MTSTSDKEYVGLFAVPDQHVPDILHLNELLSQGLNASRDVSSVRKNSVLGNNVYRRALEVSVHHVSVSLGDKTVWGYVAMLQE